MRNTKKTFLRAGSSFLSVICISSLDKSFIKLKKWLQASERITRIKSPPVNNSHGQLHERYNLLTRVE